MADHNIWLSRDDGTRLALLNGDFIDLEYVISLHQIGACSILLPGDFDRDLLAIDNMIEIEREPDGGMMYLERAFFLRRRRRWTDNQGQRFYQIGGLDGLYLLNGPGRIIANAAGSSQASKTDQADDMMKAVVREQMGTSAAAARQWNSSHFSVQADLAAGPSITKAFAWREVLRVLQDLAGAADAAGTPVYFDVVPVEPGKFEFRTFTGQPGQDRTYPNGNNPIVFSEEFGNLAEPDLEEDYSDEVTYVYCGGQGEGTARTIVEVEDATRSGRSIWGRREAWQDARQDTSTNGITAAANARLAEGKPKIRFGAKLLDVPGSVYGKDWRWGDKVSCIDEGQQHDGIVKVVRVKVDKDGKEDIDARVEVEE